MKKLTKIIVIIFILLTTACGTEQTNNKVIKTDVVKNEGSGVIEQVVEVDEKGQIIDHTDDISRTSGETNKSVTSNNSTVESTDKGSNNNSSSPSKPEAQMIRVNLEIDCKTILNNMDDLDKGYQDFVPNGGIILDNVSLEVKKNSTVLDVLKSVNEKYGLNLKTRGSAFGTYVYGIGNIEEKICGNSSGWMYSVNNVFSGQSASSYRLKDGDKIKWRFTCKPGDLK